MPTCWSGCSRAHPPAASSAASSAVEHAGADVRVHVRQQQVTRPVLTVLRRAVRPRVRAVLPPAPPTNRPTRKRDNHDGAHARRPVRIYTYGRGYTPPRAQAAQRRVTRRTRPPTRRGRVRCFFFFCGAREQNSRRKSDPQLRVRHASLDFENGFAKADGSIALFDSDVPFRD
eukprot:1177722-Prorocentrum_minimum.AAC.2